MSERGAVAEEIQTRNSYAERCAEGEFLMVKQVSGRTGMKPGKVSQRQPKQRIDKKREEILRAATLYLITKHGMFLVATGVRDTNVKGMKVWIITVTLRYTTGHEGYVGDLLYDGDMFTFLTEPAVLAERIAKIAHDPQRRRKWKEYRASTLRAGKR
jgi:hypothetical protein